MLTRKIIEYNISMIVTTMMMMLPLMKMRMIKKKKNINNDGNVDQGAQTKSLLDITLFITLMCAH